MMDGNEKIRNAMFDNRRVGWAKRIRWAMHIDDYASRQAVLEDIAREIEPL